MSDAGIFIKSFRPDFPQLAQLLESIDAYMQPPLLPVIISVPKADREHLTNAIGRRRALMVFDEDYADSSEGLTGWEHQQVCKMSAWKLDTPKTLFSIDSDSYFIRPFASEDFTTGNGSFKLVMSRLRAVYRNDNRSLKELILCDRNIPQVTIPEVTKSASLSVDIGPLLREARDDRWIDTHRKRARLQRIFPREGGHFFSMPGAIIQTEILKDIHDRLIVPNGITAKDLILICPWEYDWQLEWAIASGASIHPIEPLLFHVDSEASYRQAIEDGVTVQRIRKHFVGIAMASRHFDRTVF